MNELTDRSVMANRVGARTIPFAHTSELAATIAVESVLTTDTLFAQTRPVDEMSFCTVIDAAFTLLVITEFNPNKVVADEMSDVAVTVEVARLLVIVALGTLRSRLIDTSVVTTMFEIKAVPLTSNTLNGVVWLIPTHPVESMVIRSTPAVTTPTLLLILLIVGR
jgi:hypothetical protein